MAKAILTGTSPTQQPRLRIVRFRCIDCRAPLHYFRGSEAEWYCPDCTRYTAARRHLGERAVLNFPGEDQNTH